MYALDMLINPVAAPVAEVQLHVPTTLQVQLKPVSVGGFRIEIQREADSQRLETGYWYPNGFNDIMRGERGSLNQAINALVALTLEA